MSGVPHHLVIAAKDRQLLGDDKSVLILLTAAWLDDREYLPVRVSMLTRELYDDPLNPSDTRDWHENNVARCLRRLVRLGYLKVGKPVPSPGQVANKFLKTYMLCVPPRRRLNGKTEPEQPPVS